MRRLLPLLLLVSCYGPHRGIRGNPDATCTTEAPALQAQCSEYARELQRNIVVRVVPIGVPVPGRPNNTRSPYMTMHGYDVHITLRKGHETPEALQHEYTHAGYWVREGDPDSCHTREVWPENVRGKCE